MITEILSSFAIRVMQTSGYWGLFSLSLIESAGIPVPSEIVLPFSGFLVASGQFSLWLVAIVATLGNYSGSVILFWIGRSGGRWILDRYGKYVFIHASDIEKGETWFKRHGAKAVFWGRLLPVVRTFISLPAGVSRMSFKKFSAYTLLGALPWNFALAYVGYKAGEHWEFLHRYFHIVDIVIIAAAICLIVWYLIKHKSLSSKP